MAGIDSYTKLCLHGNGTHLSTAIRDASPAHKTVTAYGGANVGDTYYKFGGLAMRFPVAESSYMSVPDSDDWNFGSGDFTIDLWVRVSSWPAATQHRMILSQYESATRYWHFSICENSGAYKLILVYTYDGNSASFSRTISFTLNVWYHVALVRNGTEYKMYVDGTLLSTSYTSALAFTNISSALFIGTWYTGAGQYWDGRMDELRISKGIARWTADFTVPSEEYSVDDTITEALTTSDDLVPDPGLPTDAEITEDFTVHDTLSEVFDVDIDEDIALSDTFAGSVSYLCVQVEALTTNDSNVANTTYNKTLSEDVNSGDVFDGQFAVYLTTGDQNVPICKVEAKRNKGFAGDAVFPKASNTSKKGWNATHTVPKWVAEATLKRGSLFSHEERVPKLKGEATFKAGRVFTGDAVFPGFVADSTFITSVELYGATHTVPKPKGFATMTVGGRFTDYVLRYVR